jgi:hypothetical protein
MSHLLAGSDGRVGVKRRTGQYLAGLYGPLSLEIGRVERSSK